MVEVFIFVVALLAGCLLMIFSSDKAVKNAEKMAVSMGVSPILIGLFIVSIGTDLPEIANSVAASVMGHGDINIGDSFGSSLVQMTLVLGILPFVNGSIRIPRKEVMYAGAGVLLATLIAVLAVEDGFISQSNAIFLIVSWLLIAHISWGGIHKPAEVEKPHRKREYAKHAALIGVGLLGVGLGATVVVWSIINLSQMIGVPEYFISFFGTAIATSLPELVVNVMAVRRRQFELTIGDIIGSNLADTTLSIAAGPLFFPIAITQNIAVLSGMYLLLATAVVITTLYFKNILDRRTGAAFICLYLASYFLLAVG